MHRVTVITVAALVLAATGAMTDCASGAGCQQGAARAWLGGFPLDELGTKPVPPDFCYAAENASTGTFDVIRGGDDYDGLPASVGYYGIDAGATRGSDHDLPTSAAPERRGLAFEQPVAGGAGPCDPHRPVPDRPGGPHERPQAFGASRVRVRLSQLDGGVSMEVADDGIGFDVQELAPIPGHIGLAEMRERAETAGGALEIDPSPGAGTRIRCWVPVTAPVPAAER